MPLLILWENANVFRTKSMFKWPDIKYSSSVEHTSLSPSYSGI